MLKSLTKKEKEILDFIKVSTQIHGFSPSLIEIRDHFRLSAVSTVHEHISNLKKKGYILKEVSQARSIKVIDTDSTDKQFLEIPITFELTEENILRNSSRKQSVYVHKNQLGEDGKHFALLINTNAYQVKGIFKYDILIIRECDKLQFKSQALVSIGQNYYLGEIVEHRQLPFFRKNFSDDGLVSKFTIQGEMVILQRNYFLSLK